MPREIYCQSILSRPRAAPAGRHSPVPPPIPGRVRAVLAARQKQISISRLAPFDKPAESLLKPCQEAPSRAHSKAKHFYFQPFANYCWPSENTKNTSGLFSMPCGLFSSLIKYNSSVFMPFRPLAPKYRGWGVPDNPESFGSSQPQSRKRRSANWRLPETKPLA